MLQKHSKDIHRKKDQKETSSWENEKEDNWKNQRNAEDEHLDSRRNHRTPVFQASMLVPSVQTKEAEGKNRLRSQ